MHEQIMFGSYAINIYTIPGVARDSAVLMQPELPPRLRDETTRDYLERMVREGRIAAIKWDENTPS